MATTVGGSERPTRPGTRVALERPGDYLTALQTLPRQRQGLLFRGRVVADPQWKVPLFEMDFGAAELAAVARPIREGWLTMGPRVAELEHAWQERTRAEHVVAVTNGTAALHLCAVAAGLGPGDEVLCPTLTFVASANAIRYTSAEVVFVESKGERDLTLDPADCAAKITPRTKAIMVVHYGGFPADMAALLELSRQHDLLLLEDAAHAVFTRVTAAGEERMCGTWGLCGAFSLFSNKNLTSGEGGLVATDDHELARRLRLWRSHGMTATTMDRHRGPALGYDVVVHGYNYRLDEVRASLALAQLDRLPGFLAARHRIYNLYREALAELPVVLPFSEQVPPNGTECPVGIHIMSVLLPEGSDRSAVMASMRDCGVQSSVHYPPNHLFSAFTRSGELPALPRTEALSARQLTLPLYPTMGEDQVSAVAEALKDALSRL
jgi:dTDP-4-amino-4,6-dideoxygalactose transaminase